MIEERITAFVAEIEGLVRAAALDAVQEAIGGRPSRPAPPRSPAAARPVRARSAGRSGKRVRRSAEEVESIAQDVLAHVRANPGQRLGEIAKALGMETKDARRPAFQLVEEGVLRTEGQRGGTRYFDAARKRARGRKA